MADNINILGDIRIAENSSNKPSLDAKQIELSIRGAIFRSRQQLLTCSLILSCDQHFVRPRPK